MTPLEQFQQLQTPDGLALLEAIATARPTSATTISLASRLRTQWPADLVSAALTMHDLRQRAAGRFPEPERLWFTRAGLEQASSMAIARYRAARYQGLTDVWDLCCGIGGDLLGLANELSIGAITAVDRDPLHLAMAEANAIALGLADQITFVDADVRDVMFPPAAGVFIDPARRTTTGRLATGESEPPLDWCFDLARNGRPVGIKAAPGIAHDLVPAGWEFEAIAIDTDLKEAALWSPALARAPRTATVITATGPVSLHPIDGEPIPRRAPVSGDVLLDPNPAVTRAGLVEDLARSLPVPAAMIDPRIAFLVTAEPVETPFARALRVVDSFPWHEKHLKRRLRELEAGPIDIRRRGLPGDVDAISRRVRGSGARPFTVAMTRVEDQPWAIICEEVVGQEP